MRIIQLELGAAALLGLAAWGCGELTPRPAVEASRGGAWSERLRPIWEAHGLRTPAGAPSGVRFRWQVETSRGSWDLEVGLRAGRDDVAWLLEPGAVEPVRVSLAAADLRIHDSAVLGMALQALPSTFHLPWALTRGRWELRELLPPPERSESKALEVVPLTSRSGVGPFRLELDAGTGLLRRVAFATAHPAAGGAPVMLALAEYARTADGIRWAARRTATLGAVEEPADPRDLLLRGPSAAAPGPPSAVVVRETISAVRFLAGEAAERELPLPGDEG